MTPAASHASPPRRPRWPALALVAVVAVALIGWRSARSRSTPATATATARADAARPGPADRARRVVMPAPGRVVDATIAGIVVDDQGAPVADAVVGLAGREQRTDPTGRFAIAGVAPGTYPLYAHAGALAAGPIQLVVDGARADVVVRLHAGVALAATVVSVVDGRPVAGARGALALGTGTTLAGQLDAVAGLDGVLRFPTAALGNYQLTVAAEGYAPATRAMTWNDRAGLRWTTTIALEPGVVLRGRVVDPDGAGVADARVVARPPMRARTQVTYRPRPPDVMLAPVVTGADGRFTFAVPTGQALVLVASHPRFTQGESAPLVATGAAEVTIELATGRRLWGRVVDGAGTPVAGAVVSDGPPGTAPAHVTRSDDAGRYQLTGLAPGNPRVVLFAEARAARSRPMLVELDTIADAPVDLVLDQTQTLAGRVLAADGTPVVDAVVHGQRRLPPDYRVVADGPTTSLEAMVEGDARTDAHGRFELVGLAAGDYQLLARAPASGPARVSPPLMATARAIAGATDVVLTLPATSTVRGRVRTPGAGPIDATVNLVLFGGPVAVDADGEFELTGIDPTPGRYQVQISASAALPVTLDAVVAPGQVTDLGTIELTHGRTLRGRVLEQPTGGPVAGATITVDGPDGQRVASGRSDELGGYAVAVPDGPVVVHAAVTSVGGSRLIAVPADRDRADLALPETGRLEVVADGDGRVTVTATRLGGADGNFRRWELDRVPGTATFAAAVAPGRYVVRATRRRPTGRISDDVGPGAVIASVVGGDLVTATVTVDRSPDPAR